MGDRYFTSEDLERLVATPENVKTSLEKHGHVIFVLCLDENAERQKLRAAGIETERIKFISVPQVRRCIVCGNLSHYSKRCSIHRIKR